MLGTWHPVWFSTSTPRWDMRNWWTVSLFTSASTSGSIPISPLLKLNRVKHIHKYSNITISWIVWRWSLVFWGFLRYFDVVRSFFLWVSMLWGLSLCCCGVWPFWTAGTTGRWWHLPAWRKSPGQGFSQGFGMIWDGFNVIYPAWLCQNSYWKWP